jgi:hypothetical protein
MALEAGEPLSGGPFRIVEFFIHESLAPLKIMKVLVAIPSDELNIFRVD